MDVSIVACGHDVADARIHRLCAAFRRHGLRVEVLGLGSAADGPPGCAVAVVARPGLSGRLLLSFRYAMRARGRVVFAVDPDGLVAARVVGGLRRRPVVADVHEDYAKLTRDRPWARGLRGALARALVGVSTTAAKGAALTIVADEHVPPQRADNRLVVPNRPDPRMLPGRGTVPRCELPTAVYVGDIRASRGLKSMVEAVAASDPWRLILIGPVAAADAAWLTQRVEQPDLVGRVDVLGRLAPEAAWAIAAAAWCGLSLLEDTPAYRDAVPSKLFEYLAVGLPVVVTDLPRQRAMVAGRGGEVVSVDPARTAGECAQVLRRWTDSTGLDAAAAVARPPALSTGQSDYDDVAARLAALARPRNSSAT